MLFFANKSKLFILFRRCLLRRHKGQKPTWDAMEDGGTLRVSVEEFRANMEVYAQLTRQQKAKLVLMSHEDIDEKLRKLQDPYFQVMSDLAKQNDHVWYFDVRPLVRRKITRARTDPELFLDHCHLSIKGNRLVGKLLYEFLLDNQLL